MHALVDLGQSLSPTSQISMRLESVYGFLWLAGISQPIAWITQFAVGGAVTAVVCWGLARPVSHSFKAAALFSAAAAATPDLHWHDLFLLALAAAFLVHDGL